jgi:hypothetical protein
MYLCVIKAKSQQRPALRDSSAPKPTYDSGSSANRTAIYENNCVKRCIPTANNPQQNLVQVPGTASRLEMGTARNEFALGGRFQEIILLFFHALFIQVSQTALCNRIHSDQERLARWLLLSHDRIETHKMPLPPEFLAKLLGRSRSQAVLIAATFQQAGWVHYDGAELTITDRDALESVACSCYWVAKRQLAKLLQ